MTDHLTSDQDYLCALMHLNLAEKSADVWRASKAEFPVLIKEVAEEIRKLEYADISEYNNQIWEISSNLLFAFEKLQDLGIEQLREGQRQSAQEHFAKAYDLYNLFVELNQKLSSVKSTIAGGTKTKKSGKLVGKLKGLVQKVIDCCIE